MHESSSQCVCEVQANQNTSSHNGEIKVVIQIILILENEVVRLTSSSHTTGVYVFEQNRKIPFYILKYNISEIISIPQHILP